MVALLASCSAAPPDDLDGPLPTAPEAGTTNSAAVTTFAIDTLLLGDHDFDRHGFHGQGDRKPDPGWV
jgi:hypothetical protein